MYIFQLSLPLIMTLHLLHRRWWPILCPPSGMLCNVQKCCIPRAVHTLLPALTYPQWYTRLHMVRLVTQGPRGLPDAIPRVEVLTYYRSAMQSVAAPPMIGVASMCLYVILLVNKFYCWFVRKVENNICCKNFLFIQYKRNDCVMKTLV